MNAPAASSKSNRAWMLVGAIALITAFSAFTVWYLTSQERKRVTALKLLTQVWAAQDGFMQDLGYYADSLEMLSQRQEVGGKMVGPHLQMPDKEEGLALQMRLVEVPESMRGPGARREVTKSGQIWEIYLLRGSKLDGNYLMTVDGAIFFSAESEPTTKSEVILPPR